MGAGRFLRSRHPAVKVHPIEPAESPTLSTGRKVGHHRIQGISDEFIPDIVAAIHRAFSIATASTFTFGIAAAVVVVLVVSLLREAPARSQATEDETLAA